MKILAIMGSPKGKGNGYKVIKQVEENIIKMGNAEFEYIFLKDANLQLCKGCFTCILKGEDHCPLKDDRANIEQKILNADGVILSSPGYVFNVSWIMKNFIDRFAYTNHRLRFFNQKVMLVANSGGAGLNETIKGMRNALGGTSIVCELDISTPPWAITANAQKKNEKKIADASKKFYTAIVSNNKCSPGINDYLRFLFLKEISISCKDQLKADYEFYKDKEYFYDVRINPIKRAIASVLVAVIKYIMRDVGPAGKA